jgi:hypothetical protein
LVALSSLTYAHEDKPAMTMDTKAKADMSAMPGMKADSKAQKSPAHTHKKKRAGSADGHQHSHSNAPAK